MSTQVSPIGGDTSYPGMIVHKNHLWVMCFSSNRFNHLLISHDKGLTGQYAAPVAVNDEGVVNEASIYVTPKGDVVTYYFNNENQTKQIAGNILIQFLSALARDHRLAFYPIS
ncbi:MAG: hypothetical protein JJU34_13690 [Lunatimonas sp.]|uniref:hypothetical protein n=1 Tax=Lunatimonas sp. TaxID=2060141 RepID=UPI00263AAE53|nr:hypothetical protein [Lunatimonas sp.]MCC5938325.1 hypothetical protein [Lunatimonas sp.]